MRCVLCTVHSELLKGVAVMMKSFLVALVLIAGCGSDVSIMKRVTEDPSPDDSPEVTTDSSSSTLDDTPSDTDTAIDTDISELTVGYAEMHFRQVSCQACLGVSSEFQITAEFRAHLPTGGDYTSHLPDVGTCTTSVYDTAVGVTPLQATQAVSFNDLQLYPSGQGLWLNTNLYEHQYQRNTQYTIISEHGTIPNAFQTMEGFDDIQPYTLLWIDPSYAYDAVISKSGTTFTWYPVVPNSQFEVIVAVYSSDGSQFLGAVSCMENDNGYLTIPGSYIQPFPAYSITAVHLIRHREGLISSPELGGMLQTHMMWEVIGTGHVE